MMTLVDETVVLVVSEIAVALVKENVLTCVMRSGYQINITMHDRDHAVSTLAKINSDLRSRETK